MGKCSPIENHKFHNTHTKFRPTESEEIHVICTVWLDDESQALPKFTSIEIAQLVLYESSAQLELFELFILFVLFVL